MIAINELNQAFDDAARCQESNISGVDVAIRSWSGFLATLPARMLVRSEGTQMDRRLAAILAAGVVAYSRQMAADEAGTMARLRAARAEIIDPLLTEHRGRLFKVTGDGFLVEFASAVQAITCARIILGYMAERNASARVG